jgi:hypothetical protein
VSAPDGKKRREWVLQLRIAGSAAQGRRVAEPLLTAMAKHWEFVRAVPAGGGDETLEYRVRIKKKIDQADFIGRFRTAAGPVVRSADLSLPNAG